MMRIAVGVLLLGAVLLAPSASADHELPDLPSGPEAIPAQVAHIVRMVEDLSGQNIPTSGPQNCLEAWQEFSPYPANAPVGFNQEQYEGQTIYRAWILTTVYVVIEACEEPLGQDEQNGQGPG